VNDTAFPRIDRRVLATTAMRLNFCSTCAFSQACLSQGMDKSALMDLHVLVEHVGPIHAGDHVFREGDPFDAIAAVRAGTVKTYVVDRDGHEHVLGFHLPGEVIGLNAIDEEHYPCNAVALDTVMLCRFSFRRSRCWPPAFPACSNTCSACSAATSAMPRCWRATGRPTSAWPRSSWDSREGWRHAAFSPDRFQLTMARTDIANYLRLAPETVSRVLKRFQADGLLKVDRRELELIHRDQLEVAGGPDPASLIPAAPPTSQHGGRFAFRARQDRADGARIDLNQIRRGRAPENTRANDRGFP
jgi:CRP/FNR family transcriptional regulator